MFDESALRYHIEFVTGVTTDTVTPAGREVGEGLLLWDFRQCTRETLGGWQVVQAEAVCREGEGLSIAPQTSDPQLVSPEVYVDPMENSFRFARLRVAVQYPQVEPSEPYVSEWFWRDVSGNWNGSEERRLPIERDGSQRVYWTYIPASEIGQALTGLRFDPVNEQVQATVQWVAIDLVR